MPEAAAAARTCAEQAAHALEAAGDLAAVRTLRYLLAASGTPPNDLIRVARDLLDARIAPGPDATIGAATGRLPPAEELAARVRQALHAISTRLAREFETHLAEIRLHAEQQLMAGVGSPDAALAAFHADVARLAHDLETSLWAEIGWLAAAMAAETDRYGLAELAADLPAPLRRILVTLSTVETTAPGLTAGDTASGLAQAAKLIHGLAQVPGLAMDPTGLLLPLAAGFTAVAAHRRTETARRAARDTALRHVADACENARSALLEPVLRAAAQAQIFLLEKAITELAARSAAGAQQVPASDPVREALLRARAQIAATSRELHL